MADVSPKSGQPGIGPLYVKMTEPRTDGQANLAGARDIFGELSVTSQFKVCLHLTNNFLGEDLNKWLFDCGITIDVGRNAEFDFFCAEAALPGATFDVISEYGSRQGVLEKFPTRRSYSDFNITMYVDNDYQVIRLFEEWMNYINPIYSNEVFSPPSAFGQGNYKSSNDYFRIRYPANYKRIISIVKFERNFRENPQSGGERIGSVPMLTYRMLDAFPTMITALPVTYQGSNITKTTINFSYSRYVVEKSNGSIRPRRLINVGS